MKSIKETLKLKKHVKEVGKVLNYYLNQPIDDNLSFLKKRIEKNDYKGIVIYPEAVNWEPIQRPQHILRELGKDGYLCLFLVHDSSEKVSVEEKYHNVYVVNGQEKIFKLLKEQKVIFLITYFLQYVYAKEFKNRVIWVDILDRLDFFDFYNYYSKKIWNKLIKEADVVTYSAIKLKDFVIKRNDAILLPNACNPDDFTITNDAILPDMQKILKSKRKVIGYYGAIENWFDFSIIEQISNIDKYEVVIIGKCSLKKEYSHVHYLGQKDYDILKEYAKYFDLAIIPFIVNEVTDNVSPIKFFEYMALNLPVLSTPIYEMTLYKSDVVKIIEQVDKIDEYIVELLDLDKKKVKKECQKFLNENTWKKRVSLIEPLIKKTEFLDISCQKS